MKLQSHRSRRRLPEKRASDVSEIYRLLVAHDRAGAVARQLATAPHGLAECSAEVLEQAFVADAGRWARQLSVYDRGGDMGRVTADDLEVVGGLATEMLRRLLAERRCPIVGETDIRADSWSSAPRTPVVPG